MFFKITNSVKCNALYYNVYVRILILDFKKAMIYINYDRF